MPPLNERALVEQRHAVPPVRKLIEFVQKSIPGRLIRVSVNRVDRKDVSVMRVRQNCVSVLANEVRAERHVAAKAVFLEMVLAEFHVFAQRAQPLAARECPECK